MKPDIIHSFTTATRDVLVQEMGEPIELGKLRLLGGPYTAQDITVLIGLTQGISGVVMLGMDKETAFAYVSHIVGEPITEMDKMVQSGIGELANVIAGRAGVLLSTRGLPTVIAPPTILMGRSRISTPSVPRLAIAVQTPLGCLELQLAARET